MNERGGFMPRYIIADLDAKGGGGWSHIFEVFEPGRGVVHVERECRFVFDVDEFSLIHLDVLIDGRMVAASECDLLDVQDSLVHSNPGAIEDPETFGLTWGDRLPLWCGVAGIAAVSEEAAGDVQIAQGDLFG
jgi:hypothetical protein